MHIKRSGDGTSQASRSAVKMAALLKKTIGVRSKYCSLGTYPFALSLSKGHELAVGGSTKLS